MARHEVSVEDLLDGPEPLLRLTLRPWSSPLADEEAGVGSLEISIEELDQEYLRARYQVLGPERTAPRASGEDRIATAGITSSWLDSRLLDFVGLVLQHT
jgi:hypothetical protein